MCGRIVRDDVAQYGHFFRLEEVSELRITPRFNIAPTELDLRITAGERGRLLEPSRWGLIPVWAKERTFGNKAFNARAETLEERPAFRGLVRRHRCIVPASGFYEWQRQGSAKLPTYIFRADGAPLAFAGLTAAWRDPDSGETVQTHTVITCAANEFMQSLHDRMPAILTDAALEAWLDPALTSAADLLPLLQPCPDELLRRYPVSTLVNNARNEGRELIAPLPAPAG